MLKRNLKSISESKNNNSVLYLALLCLLYFFITSNYLSPSINPQSYIDSSGKIYIEISDKDGFTAIKSFTKPKELVSIQNKYGIKEALKSGDRLIVGNNEDVQLTRISGLKSISLGVAIGINSAGANDLKAIPGIGDELAQRIIVYRNLNGKLTSLDQLDNVEGIGEKKLANIKRLANLD
ncbi:MAG: helix-hairpin-helix domain-containing protein [Deltaproteobacteria bacterium]|nr:helix-hairpin-helix domain-containing protein [Deltaproteobacteria bacterium]